MLNCCACFLKSSKKKSKTHSIEKTASDRYTLQIENLSQTVSLQSSKLQTESQLEILTDTSSLPISSEPHRIPSEIPLYLPSKSPILPSSPQVSNQFSNFESILELEADPDWELKVEKPFAYIMLRTGTKSFPEIPIMKAFFDLELNVEPQLVYDVLYNPEIRQKWDSSLGRYVEISSTSDSVEYYMLNKAPWPFADRDFVETRYIRKRANGDFEVFFSCSTNEKFPPDQNGVVRGEVVTGGQIFRKRVSPSTGTESLIITTIVQADLKGEVPKKLLKVTLPASVLNWFRCVKKQVEVQQNLV